LADGQLQAAPFRLFFRTFDLFFAFAFFDEGEAQDTGNTVVGDEAAEAEGSQADNKEIAAGRKFGRQAAFAAGQGRYQAKESQIRGDNEGVGGVGGLLIHGRLGIGD
jgi:hypothetical protein